MKSKPISPAALPAGERRRVAVAAKTNPIEPITGARQRAEMCGDVRECAVPIPSAGDKTNPIKPITGARQRAEMCGDVREYAAPTPRAGDGTNPSAPVGVQDRAAGDPLGLTPRQVAAARLLALGRTGRAVAAEIGLNEHTVTRWRRTPAFADEICRQHQLALAEQVRQRRGRSGN